MTPLEQALQAAERAAEATPVDMSETAPKPLDVEREFNQYIRRQIRGMQRDYP